MRNALFLVFLAFISRSEANELRGLGRVEAPVSGKTSCVSGKDRERIARSIRAYEAGQAIRGATGGVPAPYPHYPQSGNLWDDLDMGNFVDLDPTGGILDFDCSAYAYDGHRGIDTGIGLFKRQLIGVPVFAALDGTVVDAHDGEPDMNTSWEGQPSNFVALHHGGTHYTYYLHLKRNSVAVSVGQSVKAGQQIGLTGSSGVSFGPHLHFETSHGNSAYEPFAGDCRPGPSGWESQVPFRKELYFREAVLTKQDLWQWAGIPHDSSRDAYWTVGDNDIRWWVTMLNLPANSNYSVRFLRPDNSVEYSSPTWDMGNPAYVSTTYWFWFTIHMGVTGTWHIEFTMNGELLLTAPFEVVNDLSEAVNRPPLPVEAGFDPENPGPEDPIYCRIRNAPLVGDPDYDILRYRFEWRLNDELIRDVTSAMRSDAIPHGLAVPGDVLRCTVTPSDGVAEATPAIVQAVIAPEGLGAGFWWLR